MIVILVILTGAIFGLITSKIKGSGFGLWWDIYLGMAGSTFASALMTYGYYMNNFPGQSKAGINLFSLTISLVGSAVLLYSGKIVNKTFHFKQIL